MLIRYYKESLGYALRFWLRALCDSLTSPQSFPFLSLSQRSQKRRAKRGIKDYKVVFSLLFQFQLMDSEFQRFSAHVCVLIIAKDRKTDQLKRNFEFGPDNPRAQELGDFALREATAAVGENCPIKMNKKCIFDINIPANIIIESDDYVENEARYRVYIDVLRQE